MKIFAFVAIFSLVFPVLTSCGSDSNLANPYKLDSTHHSKTINQNLGTKVHIHYYVTLIGMKKKYSDQKVIIEKKSIYDGHREIRKNDCNDIKSIPLNRFMNLSKSTYKGTLGFRLSKNDNIPNN